MDRRLQWQLGEQGPLRIRAGLGIGVAVALLAATGCASKQPQPTLVSAADSTGYALHYPELLAADADSFAAHKKQARELTSGMVAHAREIKPNGQGPLLTSLAEQADADGRRESFATAQRSDRVLRGFWDDERGPIAARVSGAAQKQVTEASCNNVDTQPAVQQALRAGVDRQLDRHVRAESEAQRLLDRSKNKLPAATVNNMQRLAEEIALASYLVNVALVEDWNALSHRAAELSAVEDTLQHSYEEEQKLQATAPKGPEQKAVEERVQQIRGSHGALGPSRDKAQRELADAQGQVQQARDEYARALDAVKASLSRPAGAAPVPAAPAPVTTPVTPPPPTAAASGSVSVTTPTATTPAPAPAPASK